MNGDAEAIRTEALRDSADALQRIADATEQQTQLLERALSSDREELPPERAALFATAVLPLTHLKDTNTATSPSEATALTDGGEP